LLGGLTIINPHRGRRAWGQALHYSDAGRFRCTRLKHRHLTIALLHAQGNQPLQRPAQSMVQSDDKCQGIFSRFWFAPKMERYSITRPMRSSCRACDETPWTYELRAAQKSYGKKKRFDEGTGGGVGTNANRSLPACFRKTRRANYWHECNFHGDAKSPCGKSPSDPRWADCSFVDHVPPDVAFAYFASTRQGRRLGAGVLDRSRTE